ncbi:MAG: tetratricopeptide repeat protein [Candidatus Sumerlaeota bacterium]|nr:tetratricopeptide repeat protein [Candidatus Sumerlaeota bacterium]
MPNSTLLNRFWRLLGMDQAEALLAELEELGPLDPHSPGAEELLFVWAMALWRANRPEEAEEKLHELLRLNSRSASGHLQLANLLDETERFEDAERHYARADELAADTSAILVNWGIMLCRSGDHERAIEKFEQAERGGADDDDLHFHWGISLEALDDLDGARRHLEVCLKRGRREAGLLSRLGMVYSDLGADEEGEALLREACAADPENNEYLFNLATCLKRRRRFEEAEALGRQLVGREPENAEYWGLYGDIALDRGDMVNARARYQRSLEINPNESYTLSGLGWVAFHSGQREEAQRFSLMALACDAGNGSALDLLRASRPAHRRLGRYTLAICGETAEGERFVKSVDCLASNEDKAQQYVKEVQEAFPSEIWWEIQETELVEFVKDERPGVCWISEPDVLE